MTDRKENPQTAAREARLAQYAALRAAGAKPWDAGQAMGICRATREAYERWYRQTIGLPPRERDPRRYGGLSTRAGSAS